MNFFLASTDKMYSFIVIWILFQSCTTVPEAEFYEVDGIISVNSVLLTHHQGWSTIEHFSTLSLVSDPDPLGYIEPLSIPFYVQQTGSYSFWILGSGKSFDSEADHITLSLLDDQGALLYQTLLKNESTSLMKWSNRNVEDQPISFQIQRPGHYRVNIRPLGSDEYIINKIHVTLNNQHPPQGTGLLTTSDPELDPLLHNREQRMELPPSWVFGPVYGGYSSFEKTTMTGESLQRSEKSELEMRDWEKSTDYGQFKIRELRKNIELMANPRLITYELPYASYDVGGFDYNETPPFDEKLLVRWVQFAAFNSVMHLFSRDVYETQLVEGQLSEESYRHINELIRLRRRLFPYIYSEYYLARGTGVKPIRGSSDFPTQYMFGDSFLAAPLYETGNNERFVNLPTGIWYDYVDGMRYDGGQSWLVEAPLHKIPLFVKAGSIIPYQTEMKTMYPAHHDSLVVEIYGGSVGTFRLYEDDGLSTLYKQGQFSTTAFRYFERDNYATFTIGRVTREFEGQSREKVLTLIFKYVQEPTSVIANEVELSEGTDVGQWYYDMEKKQMILKWIQPNDIKTDFEINF